MKTLLFISFLTTFYVFAQRDPRPKDQANVFWNGAYSLYSLSSDEEIKPNSSGKYEFWGTTNENPQPIQYSLMKGNTLYVYKFISYSECLNSCNEIRKSKGLALLQTNHEAIAAIEYKKIELMSQDQYVSYMYDEVKKKYTNAQLSPSGLVYVIENMGEGDKPVLGSKIGLHYKGTIRSDGKKFDSSYDRNSPLEFNYLVQKMIPGFEEGIGMLGKGGKATLIIPYFQAYGKEGRPGAIPPYADLVFEIEILQVDPANSSPQQGVKINNPNKSSNTYSSNTNNNETKNLPLKLSQTWTKENARIATDIDGIDLILAEDIDQWKSLCDKDQAAYCYYKFDSDNENMGFIYNYAAVRVLAPEGYRVPSKVDYEVLLEELKRTKQTNTLCSIIPASSCVICYSCSANDYNTQLNFNLKPSGWLSVSKSKKDKWKDNGEDMYLWTMETEQNNSLLSGLGFAQLKSPSTIKTVDLNEINNVGAKGNNIKNKEDFEFIEKYYGTFIRFVIN